MGCWADVLVTNYQWGYQQGENPYAPWVLEVLLGSVGMCCCW